MILITLDNGFSMLLAFVVLVSSSSFSSLSVSSSITPFISKQLYLLFNIAEIIGFVNLLLSPDDWEILSLSSFSKSSSILNNG